MGVSILDLAGREVRRLVGSENAQPRWRLLVWDGLDTAGKQTRNGVYFVRISVKDDAITKKVLRVR